MSLAIATLLFSLTANPEGNVVHEWGTFTMVIDSDGKQLDWFRPLLTEPLPAFVYTAGQKKASVLDYSVRMETPVIYFHTQQPYVASVAVAFGKEIDGQLTEWFPQADTTEGLRWPRVEIDPSEHGPFPLELGGDHYYAARATAAAGLRVPFENGIERERFLFYRGLANFSLPLRVAQNGSELRIANEGETAHSRAFWYERRGELATLIDLGARMPGSVSTIDRSRCELSRRVSIASLEEALVADGLYLDEARAMIETWRRSWFGEGSRLLFTLPRARIDALLPLTITPTPDRIERVFVGRYEIVTPELHEEILSFAQRLERGEIDTPALEAARQRYERVGYAVMRRSAMDLAERQSPLAERRFQAAWKFAESMIDSHRAQLGSVAED